MGFTVRLLSGDIPAFYPTPSFVGNPPKTAKNKKKTSHRDWL